MKVILIVIGSMWMFSVYKLATNVEEASVMCPPPFVLIECHADGCQCGWSTQCNPRSLFAPDTVVCDIPISFDSNNKCLCQCPRLVFETHGLSFSPHRGAYTCPHLVNLWWVHWATYKLAGEFQQVRNICSVDIGTRRGIGGAANTTQVLWSQGHVHNDT